MICVRLCDRGLGSLATVCQEFAKKNDRERKTLGEQNAWLENRVRALEQDNAAAKAKLTAQVRILFCLYVMTAARAFTRFHLTQRIADIVFRG